MVSLVAVEILPADGLPGIAGRAAFPRPLESRGDRVPAADRLPGASVGRAELDGDDPLLLKSGSDRELNEIGAVEVAARQLRDGHLIPHSEAASEGPE